MQKQIMIKLLEQKITKQVHHLLTGNRCGAMLMELLLSLKTSKMQNLQSSWKPGMSKKFHYIAPIWIILSIQLYTNWLKRIILITSHFLTDQNNNRVQQPKNNTTKHITKTTAPKQKQSLKTKRVATIRWCVNWKRDKIGVAKS